MADPKELVKATLIVWYDPDKHGVTGEADATLDIIRTGPAVVQLVDCEIVKDYQNNRHWKRAPKNLRAQLERTFLGDEQEPEEDEEIEEDG